MVFLINENSQIKNIYTSNNEKYLLTSKDVFLESGRDINLFNGTKILIKEQAVDETFLGISFNQNESVFKKGIFGINSCDEKFIKKLYSYFLSDIYTYYIYLISGSWGTSTRPQIRLDDEYLSFPFIEPNDVQKNKLVLLVDKLLKPYKDFYNEYPNNVYEGEPSKEVLNEINSIIEEIYQISGYEKDLIDYVLNVSRYQFQESKQHLVSSFNNSDHRNKELVLERYADVYIQEFEKIYDDEFIQVEIYLLDYFIAMNFIFLNKKPSERIIYPDNKDEKQVLKSLANSLSISQITNAKDSEHNLFIQKDIKGFEKNSFYIIKPNEYKCWHRAMAWYDVAEFKEVIQKAEVEHLNEEFNGF